MCALVILGVELAVLLFTLTHHVLMHLSYVAQQQQAAAQPRNQIAAKRVRLLPAGRDTGKDSDGACY
jgi:hypothetical protein